MVWKEQFERAMAGSDASPAFEKGLDDAGCAALEKKLKTSLPPGLRALLGESNGVKNLLKVSEDEVVTTGWLVWPAKTIATSSPALAQAALKVHEGPLVFFAPGDDVMFALDPSERVFGWYEIDRDLRPLAASLGEFVERWPAGKLEV